ncbi:MAG: sulfite exporter TauE/SafE family protein [Candidatus Aenigmarchaeota archaeon]|nr:sulfite exporter TauE/SafE family protein [Candidatus Aenigmarchaeota archaeon]
MAELAFLAAAFLSEIIGTVAGFGSSTIFLPLALFFVDFKTALVLVAFFHLSGNIGRITFFRKFIDFKIALAFGVPSIILSAVGAYLATQLSPYVFKIILGVFLMIFSIMSLSKHNIKLPSKRSSILVGGALSGFLAGFVGTGGVLRGAFLTAINLAKNKYIATAAAVAMMTDLARIPVYISGGFLAQEFHYYIPTLFVVAVAGSYIGKKIVTAIPQKSFRKVVLVSIFLVSVKFVLDGLGGL